MNIGYGLCAPGEAKRYMRKTLEEFKRLCDYTIILGNNISDDERALIKEYGFDLFEDNREWGKLQWKIKQDFIERKIARVAKEGDTLIALDMDEVFCSHATRESISKLPLEAYHVYVVDLWNDENHYKAESCFWNVRIWRWNGQTKWKQKPVHCGLAPEWAYHYHRHAPFVLWHYGLMKKEDRQAKVVRYEKYDPNAINLDQKYYDMLKSDKCTPIDSVEMCKKVEKEISSYQQTAPRQRDIKPKVKFAYVKNPYGKIHDIPERDLEQTLKRKGFTFIGWVDTQPGSVDDVEPEEADPTECALCGHKASDKRELIMHKKEQHK